MGWMVANIRCDHTKGRDGGLCPLILPYSHLCVNAPLIHFQNSAASFNGPGRAGLVCVLFDKRNCEGKQNWLLCLGTSHSFRPPDNLSHHWGASWLPMNHEPWLSFSSLWGNSTKLGSIKNQKICLTFQKGLMVGCKSCRNLPSAQRIIAVMSLHVHCTIFISFSAILCSVPTGGASGQL